MRGLAWACVPLVLGVLGAGCAGMTSRLVTAHYSSALVQIDRPEATQERYGSVVTIKPEPENKFVYEDGLFSGLFYATDSRINFSLTNKTEHSMKIVWDEAAFIGLDGQSGRYS